MNHGGKNGEYERSRRRLPIRSGWKWRVGKWEENENQEEVAKKSGRKRVEENLEEEQRARRRG